MNTEKDITTIINETADIGPNRSIAFISLVGSHNYNLNDSMSDKDYKVFIFPSFNDLYYKEMYSYNHVSDDIDFTIHDIRKLPSVLFKANINFIEVLFSKESHIYSKKIDKLFKNREFIARMNLPYLFNACDGMHFRKKKGITNYNKNTLFMKNKFGYNTKEACHAYRILDACIRYAKNGFESFQDAILYNDTEREFILDIKRGKYTKEEYDKILTDKEAEFDTYRHTYYIKNEDMETKRHIDELMYDLVKHKIVKE